MNKVSVLITLFIMGLFNVVYAQQKQELDNRVNLLFGTAQLALEGFNIEGNIFYKRLAFDYSHGISLNFSNNQLEDGLDKDQGLAIHLPWTTGFGVGYRFTEWINLRIEPKWHKFELYYDGDAQISQNLIIDYTTFTLGLGLYTNFRPFKNQSNLLKGIMIAPNVRWWPNLSSTLNDGEFSYNNAISGQVENNEVRNIGAANTPFIINVSIGYSVKF